jgi:hypothetical protein
LVQVDKARNFEAFLGGGQFIENGEIPDEEINEQWDIAMDFDVNKCDTAEEPIG